MNSKIKYLLIGLLSILLIGFLTWRYVNRPNEDLSQKTTEVNYTCAELIHKTESDTSTVFTMSNMFIGVSGIVKKVDQDSLSTTIELGDSNNMSSIICQIDTRHRADFMNTHEGDLLSLKGKISGCVKDTDLGLGCTILMNFCSINKTNK